MSDEKDSGGTKGGDGGDDTKVIPIGRGKKPPDTPPAKKKRAKPKNAAERIERLMELNAVMAASHTMLIELVHEQQNFVFAHVRDKKLLEAYIALAIPRMLAVQKRVEEMQDIFNSLD